MRGSARGTTGARRDAARRDADAKRVAETMEIGAALMGVWRAGRAVVSVDIEVLTCFSFG